MTGGAGQGSKSVTYVAEGGEALLEPGCGRECAVGIGVEPVRAHVVVHHERLAAVVILKVVLRRREKTKEDGQSRASWLGMQARTRPVQSRHTIPKYHATDDLLC